MEIHNKISNLHLFSFFRIFSYDFSVYTYFTNAATSSTLIDDVTQWVMYRICNTKLEYHGFSFRHIERKI